MNIQKFDWSLISLVICTNLIGLLTLYGGSNFGQELAFQNAIKMVIGLAVMFTFYYISYHKLVSYSPIIYVVCILLLIFTLFPFIGVKVKGARSWIRFFGLGIQPVELAKIALILILSRYFTMLELKVHHIKDMLYPTILVVIPIILVALQPDLGYSLFLLPLALVVFFLGGANISLFIGVLSVGFLTIFIPLFLEYHKYILNGEIYDALKVNYLKIAEAIRVLNFDMWGLLNDSDNLNNVSHLTRNKQWAIRVLKDPHNRSILQKVIQNIYDQHPLFLRDFLNSRLAVIITVASSFILYIVSYVTLFFSRQNILRLLGNFFLILSLGLTSGYLCKSLVVFKPHQVVRLVSFANPDEFAQGAGYQLRHSLITLGSGRVTGKGFAQGNMTKGEVSFLPEWFNDFIFSVVGEQFGFWGCLLLLLLLFSIVGRGLYISLNTKDNLGALLASSLSMLIFLHVLVNISITCGLFPVTGLPLPFVSHGGSNLISSYVCIGILLNIDRQRLINA